MRAVLRGWTMLILLLAIHTHGVIAQEEAAEQEKKNPDMRNSEMNVPGMDTSRAAVKSLQQPLPKIDLPEFIITGTASIDLPKLEKILIDDSAVLVQPLVLSPEKIHRDRETLELEMKNRGGNSTVPIHPYSGFAAAGIGTFYTPHAEVQYGQSYSEYFYFLDGHYSMTRGFAPNTDQSGGGVSASGGTMMNTSSPILQNAALDGLLGYRSESYRFYGSSTPDLQRSVSDFQVQAGLENLTLGFLPYSAGISLESVNISDSSASKTEARFDFDYQTTIPVATFPLHPAFHFMTASGGLKFLDISVGARNVWDNGFSIEGELHYSWAEGMGGQSIGHLNPRLTARYQATSQHSVFLSYDQMIVPATMTSQLHVNRYLSAVSMIRQEYINSAGALGIESDWSDRLQSRVSLDVKSISDLPLYSDSSRQGVWMLVYGGTARIVTFCAEMVAKLNSNDYFASDLVLRSTHDSFLDGKIPYMPAMEMWISYLHNFGPTITVYADIRMEGKRTTDLTGTNVLANYAVLDVRGEYVPFDFLRLSLGIKNLTSTKYETWRAYREFPFTMHVDARIKW